MLFVECTTRGQTVITSTFGERHYYPLCGSPNNFTAIEEPLNYRLSTQLLACKWP
jgi:hypothetical protein